MLQKTILTGVLFLHFAFILMVLVSSPFIQNKKAHKPLVVRTVTSKPAVKTISQAQPQKKTAPAPATVVKKETPPAPAPVKKPAPVVKKQPPPAPTAKKEPAIADKTLKSGKQPPPPQNRAKISDSLLKELEENIAKIENKSDKPAIGKQASAAPIALQIDQEANAETSDYSDILISHLHRSLSLPDYGEVKIQLSLRQDGTVAKVTVLKTQNEKNRQYLESNLPRLRFPRFDGDLANKKEHTFVLTFCNEL